MGNHHSHDHSHKSARHERGSPSKGAGDNISITSSKKAISRTPSGSELKDHAPSQLIPVESLAKILLQKSLEESAVNGITKAVFARCVFPKYRDFAERLFQYFHAQSKAKTVHLGVAAFKQQVEKFLAFLDDEKIREAYILMYSEKTSSPESPGGNNGDMNREIRTSNFRNLLMTCYRIAMDHYSEGPQTCILQDEEDEDDDSQIHRTLTSVTESCFHLKQSLSAQYVTHWLEHNCPRLLLPLHRFTVHSLTTAYRVLELNQEVPSTNNTGIDLTTPVLDKQPPFVHGSVKSDRLMPVSQAWLLAASLPQMYSRPQSLPTTNGSGQCISSHVFLAKLLCTVPSHWVMLYNSDQHGQGTNRFLHHVLAYRGPTITILRAEEGNIYCVACPNEWKESNLYWGSDETVLIQLLPKFLVIDRGPKMLYLNTNIRGYPLGLRIGKDTKKPLISVDGGFEKIEFKSIPYNLRGIEVWGCGDQASREKQLDIKNWQFKEAERQRQVKLSAADWLDHPDRYLLQLAGRPNYNENQS